MDEEQLRPLFEQAGPIAHIMVIRDRQTDAHRGERIDTPRETIEKRGGGGARAGNEKKAFGASIQTRRGKKTGFDIKSNMEGENFELWP